MKTKVFMPIIISAIIISVGCNQGGKTDKVSIIPADIKLTPVSVEIVENRLGIYASFKLTSDISHLSGKEKQILPILFEVANIMEELYWEQAIGDKDNFLARIQDPGTRIFTWINYGPWDRLNGNKSFITEIGNKPAGANFYPSDMTKEEFDAFDDPNKTSLYTLIRRNKAGILKSVWYHEAFAERLEKASSLLKQAAKLAEDAGFKNYLTLRAEALITDEYQASDFAWMDMKNSNIDFVVGPIENYEDALYGYKAAFESFILIKDIEWSKKLAKYGELLPILQKELPVEDEYKKEVPGANADINAYDVIYYSGDCNAGSKTIAINLPNDEEVHLKIGSRKLQLKNAMRAKFEQILVPISKTLIDQSQQKYIKFDAFFENTMFHEVGHAMGIKNTLDGSQTVREALKEKYSSMEEAKADIMGLYLVTKLYEMGELTKGAVMDNYVTFFAGIFRSSRFGAASAHGKANMMRFNYFTDHGVFTRSNEGIYTIHFDKMKEAVIGSMQDILHIQGDGNYEAATQLILETGVVMPMLQGDLDRLGNANIPVDIIFEQGLKNLDLN
ncbi:MAG: Zn-dependent hydrolase [Bacteroidetes bacterium]|nr:Zn-dependent hydrolase [Bacteroidota bacterium]